MSILDSITAFFTEENIYKRNIAIKETVANIDTILTGVVKLPEKTKVVSNQWAKFGWVPNLPSESGMKLIETMSPPKTRDEADKFMLEKIESMKIERLFDEIDSEVKKYQHNEKTFKEAVESFNFGLNSSCALLLFALIDSCFIKGQPLKGNRRKTAQAAIKVVNTEEKNRLLIMAKSTANLIDDLFIYGNDFDPKIEAGLKRNFISHGMNQYNPNKLDCIKLFVLLYNVYKAFDLKVFYWK